jgi:hypothetical protein
MFPLGISGHPERQSETNLYRRKSISMRNLLADVPVNRDSVWLRAAINKPTISVTGGCLARYRILAEHPLTIFFGTTILMTGAGVGGGSGATDVSHDKVMATLAKGGPLAQGANYTVVTNSRTKGAVPEIHEKTTHIWYVLDGSAT